MQSGAEMGTTFPVALTPTSAGVRLSLSLSLPPVFARRMAMCTRLSLYPDLHSAHSMLAG